ncbi:MAG: hypothetical protein J3K34DRAFT_427572 [Monoraphidium minutum]|nr:MAG: hypothetical protein J3K34DRAFT_427572 [Monoraphidium minutum]
MQRCMYALHMRGGAAGSRHPAMIRHGHRSAVDPRDVRRPTHAAESVSSLVGAAVASRTVALARHNCAAAAPRLKIPSPACGARPRGTRGVYGPSTGACAPACPPTPSCRDSLLCHTLPAAYARLLHRARSVLALPTCAARAPTRPSAPCAPSRANTARPEKRAPQPTLWHEETRPRLAGGCTWHTQLRAHPLLTARRLASALLRSAALAAASSGAGRRMHAPIRPLAMPLPWLGRAPNASPLRAL